MTTQRHAESRPRLTARRRALFAGVLGVGVVAFLELFLRLLALSSPVVANALRPQPMIPDAQFGWRPNPAYSEHDVRGFRNASVPASVDVLALGDSQTYGACVGREQAWPAVLQSLTGLSTYNMGVGGWGPVHSVMVLADGLRLKPKVVVEAVYAGNDLWDAYDRAVVHRQCPELLTAVDGDLRSRAEQAEAQQPFLAKILRATPQATTPAVKEWLQRNSEMYVLARRLKHALLDSSSTPSEPPWHHIRASAMANPGRMEVAANETCRTVFTSAYRFAALDRTDPRIQIGFEVTVQALAVLRDRANKADAAFVAVLLLTKALVFFTAARDLHPTLPARYFELVRAEQAMWAALQTQLVRRRIRYVDALPILRTKLASGQQPYRHDADGHPNAIGHRAIAEAVAGAVRRLSQAPEGGRPR